MMMDFLMLVAYVVGFGFLSYLTLSALVYLINAFKKWESKPVSVVASIDSFSRSTPNMLVSLDKQLNDMDLQVVPSYLGDFDTGVVQSRIDDSIVGNYEFVNSNDGGGVYSVTIKDANYGEFNSDYNVNENHNIADIPEAVSKMLMDEFNSIAGRQAETKDHKYFHENGVTVSKGILLASKKHIIKHNHVGDEKLDSGRTFKVAKNDILIPIKNVDGKFLSYQVVNSSCAKNVRIASSIKGGFFAIGDFPSKNKEYVLCEDYLTGSTLNRVTGDTVLVCIDVQNIPDVARSILFKDSDSKLTFATAKDSLTKNQARIKKALQFANEFNMPFIFPVFPVGKKFEQYKTWNELQKFVSDGEMKLQIERQVEFFLRVGKEVAIPQVVKKYGVVYN